MAPPHRPNILATPTAPARICPGPVYNQASFSSQARDYCLSYFNKDLGSSWTRVMQVGQRRWQ